MRSGLIIHLVLGLRDIEAIEIFGRRVAARPQERDRRSGCAVQSCVVVGAPVDHRAHGHMDWSEQRIAHLVEPLGQRLVLPYDSQYDLQSRRGKHGGPERNEVLRRGIVGSTAKMMKGR